MRTAEAAVILVRAAFSAAVVCGAPAGAASDGPDGPPPAVVARAIAAYSAQTRGVIGFVRHFDTVVRVGPVSHSEQSESGFLMSDGAFVAIAYYRIVEDGRPEPASRVARRESATNEKWRRGEVFFKEPYDPRFADDYRFAQPRPCAPCPPGAVSVSFTSALRDEQHGDGFMLIDQRSGRVLKLQYAPNRLPRHATSGTVTETGGQVLPHLWYVARIDESFSGREALFSGTGIFVGTFDRFRRFASLADGLTGLRSQTL